MTDFLKDCNDSSSCLDCTRRSPVFNQLNQQDLEDLNQNRYEVAYAQGEILFKQGAAMSHLLSLTKGYAALILESNGKREHIIKICKPYDLIGGLGIFHDGRHHYTAIALSDIKVCFLEKDNFLRVFHRNPILADNFIKQISIETKLLYSLLVDFSSKSLQQRVASALLRLQEISDPIDQNIFDHKTIALMVNGAKDNVVRVIKEWEKKGFMEINSLGMRITKPHKLT